MTTEDTAAQLAEIRTDYIGVLLAEIDRLTIRVTESDAVRDQARSAFDRVSKLWNAKLAELELMRRERDRLAGLLDHATVFEFSDLPLEHDERRIYTVTVELWDTGRWKISRFGGRILNTDGEWTYGPVRDDVHLFDLDAACRIAATAATTVTYRGKTAADVLARKATLEGDQ